MATLTQTHSAPPSKRSAGIYRRSRCALYMAHTPTLEPMMDEETEDEDEGSPETPSVSSTSTTEYCASPPHARDASAASAATDDASPSYEVSPSPLTGGVGLFATRAIPRGALVFSEHPLFTQPLHPAPTNSTVMAALAQCTREQQRDYFTLSNAYKHPRPGQRALLPALGIFETNALPCGPSPSPLPPPSPPTADAKNRQPEPSEEREGVFLLASLLNHSCRPNLARAWDARTGALAFRTLRDVPPGEELCVNYAGVDVLGTRAQRAEDSARACGFSCTCSTCALEGEEGEESDRRRAAVRRLFEDVGRCAKEPTLGMRKIKIALKLLKEEGLVHYEASFCFDAFQFCVLVSDFANAKAWARKAWEASSNTSGPESPAARMFKMYWANPRAHQLAGALPRTTLSGPD